MDLYQDLIKDHREIHDRMERMKAGNGAPGDDAFALLFQMLAAHMELEERYLYPVLVRHAGVRMDVLEALEEHGLAKQLVNEMEKTPMEDEHWTAKLNVLGEVLDHHINEEEGTLFQKARDILDAEKEQVILNQYDAIRREHLVIMEGQT